MNKCLLKKNDLVEVIAGDAASTKTRGKILKVLRKKGKILVENVNIVKKHVKATQPEKPSGILESPSPIDISNVMLVCPNCNKKTRIAIEFIEVENKTKKLRKCKKCNELIDK